jgi:hypothetical protein
MTRKNDAAPAAGTNRPWRGHMIYSCRDQGRTTIMTKIKALVAFALVALFTKAGLTASAAAEWPARIFAPYMYIGQGDNFKLRIAPTPAP